MRSSGYVGVSAPDAGRAPSMSGSYPRHHRNGLAGPPMPTLRARCRSRPKEPHKGATTLRISTMAS
eukprot:8260214-Alexandrium_andersonii.AAC.1